MYGCGSGASGRNCRRVTTINTPDDEVKKFCHDNPNSDFVPNAANYTASDWRCKNGRPVIDRRSTPGEVDDHGYLSGVWEKIPQAGGSEPEPEPTLPRAARSQEAEGASAEPKYPFVTSEGAILCQTPFAIKEAKAAMAASDKGWFDKTGCVRAPGGLRVVLIEASLGRSSVWRGRVYPHDDEANGGNVFFDPWEISTFAWATTPVPLAWMGPRYFSAGDKAMQFRSRADAERWYTQNIPSQDKPYIPHKAIDDGNGTFRLLLGPTAYRLLDVVCPSQPINGKPSCYLIGRPPS